MSVETLELPPYTRQSPEVAARFEALKQRPVTLDVQGLTKKFATPQGEITALSDVSFEVHRREFTCVIGASGCGKSTLIRILAGLETATEARFWSKGKRSPDRDRTAVWCFRATLCFHG